MLTANPAGVDSREYRAVTGLSMGGIGASKFAAKFPDLFCCGVNNDGAMVTWASMLQFHAALAHT